MLESYFTIRQNGQSKIEIKKSQFICSLKRVYSEEEAKMFIAHIKKEHWKANHNCSAFILGQSSEVQRSNDDGEPSGTAGIPMLEVLKKQQLVNVIAVVTRYFGGIKLGTGGLIRAYSHAVSQTINEVGIVKGKLQQEIRLLTAYTNLSRVQHFIDQHGYTLKEIIYEESVTFVCLVDETIIETFKINLLNLLNGQIDFKLGECSYQEIPIKKED